MKKTLIRKIPRGYVLAIYPYEMGIMMELRPALMTVGGANKSLIIAAFVPPGYSLDETLEMAILPKLERMEN